MPEWGASVAFGIHGLRNPPKNSQSLNPPPPQRRSEDDADGGFRSRFLGTGNAVAGPGCQEDTEQTLLPSQQGPGPSLSRA